MTYIRLAFVALTCAVLRHARAQTPETFRERMYHRLSNNAPCWTLLDQHGEVGCRSQDMSGVSAVVRYIRDDEDVNNYMGECAIYDGVGRCRGEYAVVLESSLIFADTFSDMVDCPCTSSLHVLHPQTLINKTNTDGDVTETNQAANNSEADGSRANNQQEEVSEFPEHTHPGFSPAEKSPNAIYGLYHDKPDKQVLWNAGGGAQERTMLNKPITLVTNGDDITYLRKHARNGSEVNKPSLLSNSFMHGAGDADVCLRRGYCDPVGGWNVFGSLFPMTNSTPTLVVSAALDSTSLFKGSAIGASATVAGLAALLIASQALSSLSTDIKETMTKNILFSLYNGESYGYIGSSRFVTELREGRLPVTMQNSSLSFADVEAVIEVGHLGSRGRDPNAPTPLYVHRDPTPQSEQTTDAMIEVLLKQGQALEEKSDDGREVELATAAHLLPPGSLHSWLRWGDRHLPHVHIADHNSDGFTNDYYGSFLDDAKNLGVYDLLAMQHLCSASTVLARSLYLIAGGTEHLATTINADCTALKGLVTSLTVSMDSEYVRDITNGTECAARGYPGSADNQPLSLYVGVAKQRPQCGSVAYVAYLVLMRALTKTAVPSIDDMGNCGTEGYMWLDGACYHSTQTAMGRAISPAFLFNTDTGAHEIVNKSFSMWTESEWSPDTPYTMAFVAESPSERLVAMVTGLATSFLSICVVLCVQRYGILSTRGRDISTSDDPSIVS